MPRYRVSITEDEQRDYPPYSLYAPRSSEVVELSVEFPPVMFPLVAFWANAKAAIVTLLAIASATLTQTASETKTIRNRCFIIIFYRC